MGKYKVGDYIATNFNGRYSKTRVLAQVTGIVNEEKVYFTIIQGEDTSYLHFDITSEYGESTKVLTKKDMETYRLLYG